MKKIMLLTCLATLTTGLYAANCSSVEAVKQAQATWATTLAGGNPKAMAKLYAPDAILLATYEDHPLTDKAGRLHYFEELYKKLPHTQVHYDEDVIRILPGGDAVSSGFYTFSGMQNGKEVKIPARFTFVYENLNGQCVLIAHHSSEMPV